VRFIPSDVTLRGAKASQRFVVLGTYADGLERDVTAQSSFSLSNVSTAEVDPTGRVVARADGTALLKAERLGRTATANIRTEYSQTMRPFSFARDIVGDILTRRGCNGSACHGGVKGRGASNFRLKARMLAKTIDGSLKAEPIRYSLPNRKRPSNRAWTRTLRKRACSCSNRRSLFRMEGANGFPWVPRTTDVAELDPQRRFLW